MYEKGIKGSKLSAQNPQVGSDPPVKKTLGLIHTKTQKHQY